MNLPMPDLDDRRFQDLVDDAKRLVQQRCPEWTDHNVSDPGVTLIETFAHMTDQLLFRLNRVPDRMYLTFLQLIGLRLLPPTPARAPVTFWLSAPATVPLTVAAGTRVGTIRTETEPSIEFATLDELVIAPRTVTRVRTEVARAPGEPEQRAVADRTDQLTMNVPFAAFGTPPTVADALLIGLDDPAPHNAVRIEFDGRVDGVGVNPKRPPLTWEAWTGEDWTECQVSLDETGGLNRSGAVIVHLPAGHEASVVGGERAGWLRARVVEPEEGQPPYTAPPFVHGLTACTVGGTIDTLHGEIVAVEPLGESEGVPGQTFRVSRSPLLAGIGAPVVETSSSAGWRSWTLVEDFAGSTASDEHCVLAASSGQVLFGPAVREPDGTLRQYGAVPELGAQVRIRRYVTGGGPTGNVGVRAIRTLKSSIPFVAGVENLRPAHGGVAGETLDQAKVRGPLLLRSRSRAVTTEDYEAIAREAAPEVARVRCVPAGDGDSMPGAVRVLVVPAAAGSGQVPFENLLPSADTLAGIARRLDETRVIGARVVVEPPLYRGITVVGRLVARPRVSHDRLRADALDRLYRFLSPLPGGGPDGAGWPFGRPVQAGELFGLLQQVSGVQIVEDIRLFTADPVTGVRGKETQRVDLEANSLVFSFDHQLRVEEH
ncbi:MAG TPA: putative baseplate assembly protein [Pseudonocardiaceae bacterium]|jgi:predicted phage baseplate assembly protein|nr:putative baseplate assembly protein [Pseudonocardiaceae bacterium]